jgi:hypothetical protein
MAEDLDPLVANQFSATSAMSFQPLSMFREWLRPSRLDVRVKVADGAHRLQQRSEV